MIHYCDSCTYNPCGAGILNILLLGSTPCMDLSLIHSEKLGIYYFYNYCETTVDIILGTQFTRLSNLIFIID